MSYTCKRCGAKANIPGHLCDPCGDRNKCRFCGEPDVDAKHICHIKLSMMRYTCDGCGRIATDSRLLCKPTVIG